MTLLPNGPNGRDAYNGSVWNDTDIVWEVTLQINMPVVASVPGTGEVERTGERVTEERIYHFLAPGGDDKLIKALVAERFKQEKIVGEIIYKPICKIDGRISFSHK